MSRCTYNIDLSDAEWHKIDPMITTAKPERRPRSQNMREIANAVFYIVKVGKQWRLLPHDLPKWQTVCYYCRPWESDGTWKKIHGFLRIEVRVRVGRKVESSAAMVEPHQSRRQLMPKRSDLMVVSAIPW